MMIMIIIITRTLAGFCRLNETRQMSGYGFQPRFCACAVCTHESNNRNNSIYTRVYIIYVPHRHAVTVDDAVLLVSIILIFFLPCFSLCPCSTFRRDYVYVVQAIYIYKHVHILRLQRLIMTAQQHYTVIALRIMNYIYDYYECEHIS